MHAVLKPTAWSCRIDFEWRLTCDGLDIRRHLFPRDLVFDDSGRVRIERLAAGAYEVRWLLDGALVDAAFTVTAGGTTVLHAHH
jgi:hypothetical protein